MPDSPFQPGLLRFLRELRSHNNPVWFRANRARYEADVREPAIAFIRAMAAHIERISSHLTARDTKVGGSLMRIHRDVRFSKDKTPYKTNLGIQFRHEAGKDVHAPGLYFHVDPDDVFLGVGIWRPDATALAAVRTRIDEDSKGWRRVRNGKRFRDTWELAGDSLKRPPRGYSADHPWIEDIKRKDHFALCRLRPADVTRPDLVGFATERYRQARPYLAWLAEALDLPF